MPQIKCTVSLCKYWHNEVCSAEKVEVAGNGVPGASADTSPKTQCVTMQK